MASIQSTQDSAGKAATDHQAKDHPIIHRIQEAEMMSRVNNPMASRVFPVSVPDQAVPLPTSVDFQEAIGMTSTVTIDGITTRIQDSKEVLTPVMEQATKREESQIINHQCQMQLLEEDITTTQHTQDSVDKDMRAVFGATQVTNHMDGQMVEVTAQATRTEMSPSVDQEDLGQEVSYPADIYQA